MQRKSGDRSDKYNLAVLLRLLSLLRRVHKCSGSLVRALHYGPVWRHHSGLHFLTLKCFSTLLLYCGSVSDVFMTTWPSAVSSHSNEVAFTGLQCADIQDTCPQEAPYSLGFYDLISEIVLRC